MRKECPRNTKLIKMHALLRGLESLHEQCEEVRRVRKEEIKVKEERIVEMRRLILLGSKANRQRFDGHGPALRWIQQRHVHRNIQSTHDVHT